MEVLENVSLSRYTSYHVGGPARYFIRAKSDDDVKAAVLFAEASNLPLLPLGQGSNMLFPDEGFPGVIVHLEDRSLKLENTQVTAGSGVFMRQLVTFALKNNLRGLEELAGIPGTVGGSVRGNAGTWATEIKDVLVSAWVLRRSEAGQWEFVSLSNRECDFGYRGSIFKLKRHWIVLGATFALTVGDPAEGEALVRRDLEQRHIKQPYDAPSAGSVFKNPDKEHGIYSGKLIESCDLKGHSIGGAEISSKHANFIVNRNQATAGDILALIHLVQKSVKEKHNIELMPEIEIVDPTQWKLQ